MRTTKAIVLVACVVLTGPAASSLAYAAETDGIKQQVEAKIAHQRAEVAAKIEAHQEEIQAETAIDPTPKVQTVKATAQSAAPAPEPTPQPTPAPEPASAAQSGGEVRSVESTNYCLRGTMANGEQVHSGAVAMNGVDFGTRWKVLSGPYAGNTYTVKDRIGWGSQFDIWVPSCEAALQYGRQRIKIQRVG